MLITTKTIFATAVAVGSKNSLGGEQKFARILFHLPEYDKYGI